MKKVFVVLLAVLFPLLANAQTGLKKVYNEDVNPIEQIDQTIVKAKSEGKFVICQVGMSVQSRCPQGWCLPTADGLR